MFLLFYSVGKVLPDLHPLAVDRREATLIRLDQEHPSIVNLALSLHNATRQIAGPLRSDACQSLSLAKLPRVFFRQSVFLSNLVFTSIQPAASGDEGTRTPDIRLAKAALSHLSYIPRTERGSGPDWIRTSDPCVISTVL